MRNSQSAQWRFFVAMLFFTFSSILAVAQTTAFTYQGKLSDNGAPANGSYDLQFSLFDHSQNGLPLGAPITLTGVSVVNGLFTVQLDFGPNMFTANTAQFLEIGVRPSGANAPFTVLAPRAPITATPYTIRAISAALAENATNAITATTATTASDSIRLGGVSAAQYVQTTDSRLTDARAPLPGNSNYVQNGTAQQTSSNFNISGNGTAGGTLSANLVNSTTQYNIGGTPVLSAPAGTANTFIGLGAGAANPSGGFSTFVGFQAGFKNTTGNTNSFFGSQAGNLNTSGASNSFFGFGAGQFNTTNDFNSFFGYLAGNVNTVCCNAFFGAGAGGFNSTGAGNSFFGKGSGGLNTTGNHNSFFGLDSGGSNTANDNSFFGYLSGGNNAAGTSNAFFGSKAGLANTSGSFNSFFGFSAGIANTTAINNSFFGQAAGFKNTTGSNNTFLGNGAGLNNQTASGNTFVGSLAGPANTSGINNTFIGANTGASNISGNSNILIGANVANNSATGNGNTLIGTGADGAAQVTNATAIGQNSFAGASNSVILGGVASVNGATVDTVVGMGVTAPTAKLHIRDNTVTKTTLLIEGTSSAGAGIEISNKPAGGASWIIYSDKFNNPNISNGKLHFLNQNTNQEIMNIDPTTFTPSVNITGQISADQGNINGNFTAGDISVANIGIGGITQLCISGQNGGFFAHCSSSLRYKKDLHPYTPGLSLINRLNPILFRWKSDESLDLGFGAEDIEKVEPLLVTHNQQGQVEGVKYDRITAVLVNAMKEQQSQIERQQQQIENLKRLVCGDHPGADICK